MHELVDVKIRKVVAEANTQFRHLERSVNQIRQESRKTRSVVLETLSKASMKLMQLDKNVNSMDKYDGTSTTSSSTFPSSTSAETINEFTLLVNS